MIADRVVVLGEDRRVLADGHAATRSSADRDLLIRANLIHEHLHEHGGCACPFHGDDGHHEGDGMSA